MSLIQKNRVWGRKVRPGWSAALAGVALLALILTAKGQVSVETIGGGVRTLCGSSAGFVSGSTYDTAQFHMPWGSALDSLGNLFIADRANGDVEQITQAGNRASSETIRIYEYYLATNASHKAYYVTNYSPFPGVVGVAVDSANNLYVLTTNTLSKLDQYFNVLGVIPLNNFTSSAATALVVANDSRTNIFISFTNQTSGTILRLPQTGPELFDTVVSSYEFSPAGLALRQDGQLGVTDTLNNGIYVVPTNDFSTPTLVTGGGGRGWADGSPVFAKFDQPHGIAASSDGRMVVCDTLNNRLRVIDTNYNTTTLYGTASNVWTTTCCSCTPTLYAGWVDGSAGISTTSASGREPVGVTISTNGTLFVTELYYNLIRAVTGSALSPVTAATAVSTNIPSAPTISPSSGYFPQCQTVTVTSPAPEVFYTTDGTTPTTNSTEVLLTYNLGFYTGTLQWCNPLENLSQLRLISVNGSNISAVVSGQSSSSNQLGFVRSPVAGVGSIAVVPLIVDLQSNGVLKSLQFRVEVTPNDAQTPMIAGLTLLPITTNDFISLIGPAAGNAPVAYESFSYTTASNGQGLVVAAAGNGSGLNIQNFGVAALLEIPIPPTALPGQSYTLNLLYPSGTSDGVSGEVTLGAMTSQTLTVADVSYFAGDSSPAYGYDAGEFGDGVLNSSDVNNALYASAGIRVPYPFSDAYNAMDVYPETAGEIGDGVITYLDWQTILRRSLGLDTNNWIRFWTNGGFLSHRQISWIPGGAPAPVGVEESLHTKMGLAKSAPGAVWYCQASVGAGTATNMIMGNACSLPVYVNVSPGNTLGGFQFRATVVPNGGAPSVGQIQFNTAAGIPAPVALSGLSSNDIVRAWSLGAFATPLKGSNYLGTINFQIPLSATAGQSYALHFSGVDGASNYTTPCQMESFPGAAWVLSTAQQPPSLTSDEWKLAFFGSLTNVLAADGADADGDGSLNWQEYVAGTDPTNPLSKLQFGSPTLSTNEPARVALSWLTAPGKTYVLQSIPAIGGTNWTAINTNSGDGEMYQFLQTNYSGSQRFYRLRLQP
ncbi:MAG TPA: chitobiase/beta-hexosaminidase C-terminal domain-containing protein [Candidatus Saccharimonadales bacterium]|nr:chitobiase/beta-hexosaminidase C-terminal domain-containing protein [Candidatus Saccharimonadales bacterium]